VIFRASSIITISKLFPVDSKPNSLRFFIGRFGWAVGSLQFFIEE